MKYFTLTVKEDGATGELGWLIDQVPHNHDLFMCTTDPIVIAHDVFEHQNGFRNIGTVHDEMEALGGVWFVRGQHGELRRDGTGSARSVEENLAADLVRMFIETETAGFTPFLSRGRTRQSPKHDLFEEEFQAVIDRARKDILSEYEQEIYEGFYPLSVDDYLLSAINYMRLGCTKAARRFGGYGGYGTLKGYDAFWTMAEGIKPWVNRTEFEGQRLKVGYSFSDCRVEELYLEEDY